MAPSPGVFVSHSWQDKTVAKKLAEDLIQYGARVWIDEAEILVGDSLIEKIRQGIEEMDYVAALISSASVRSRWVAKELDIAMNQEIKGKRIKVLPILLEDCELPGFLEGKVYADLRTPDRYDSSLKGILVRLGLVPKSGIKTELPLRQMLAEASHPIVIDTHPELEPVVDDFGSTHRMPERVRRPRLGMAGNEPARAMERSTEDYIREDDGARATPEPTFGKPPASFFPARDPQVFVSYAWGDETPEGRRRGKLVDDLCTALGLRGVKVRRDRNELQPGGLISEFMDRLAEGDFVLAVISDKYLRSEYCMYELFRIYRNCVDQPERFVRKVIPLIVSDAKLDHSTDRLHRAIYWNDAEAQQKPLVERNVAVVGAEFFRKFKLIGEFARNTSDMLELLVDKLQPRDFDRQAAQGFQEVLSRIGIRLET